MKPGLIDVYEVMIGNEDCRQYNSGGLYLELAEAQKAVAKAGSDPWARVEKRIGFDLQNGRVLVARKEAEDVWTSEQERVRRRALEKLSADERKALGL